MKGSNYSDLMENILVFWKVGAYKRRPQEVRLYPSLLTNTEGNNCLVYTYTTQVNRKSQIVTKRYALSSK